MPRDKVLWLSANLFGRRVLDHVIKNSAVPISGIITMKEGSSTRMYDGVDGNCWSRYNLPVYRVSTAVGVEECVSEINPSLVVMCGWRQMLSLATLNLPKLGFVGFHPTLLPKGRGPAPIINTILEGWKISGVTMFYPCDRVDAGDIVGQKSFPICREDDAWDVYQKVIVAGCILAEKYLPQIIEGRAPRVSQNEGEATYFPKRTLADNEILPDDSMETAHRKIRAFSKPYNGAFIQKDGRKLVIWKAELDET